MSVNHSSRPNVIVLYPGHPSPHWSANNRLKRARILIFAVNEAPGPYYIRISKEVWQLTVNFLDIESWKHVALPPLPSADTYLGVLLIEDVYRGSRWNDTVIAEFLLDIEQ